MGLIGEAVIQELRRLKTMGYSDQFTRLVHTPHATDPDRKKPTYPAGESYACRVVPKPSPDVLPGADVEMADADLHFGLDTPLLSHDRVRITHLHGDAVEELDYAIVKGPVRSSTGNSATIQLLRE